MESEGLRFASSRGLIIFSLSHACDKTKNIFLYFFTELKTYHLSYFYQHKSLTFNYELGTIEKVMNEKCHIQFEFLSSQFF